jgi:uncharacterized protein with HEPN domain
LTRVLFDKDALLLPVIQSHPSLDTDRMLVLSLVKLVEIVGEVAVSIPKPSQANYPQIPWSQIIGMRNRLIHAYHDVDKEIVLKTVVEDLPPLIAELEKIVL